MRTGLIFFFDISCWPSHQPLVSLFLQWPQGLSVALPLPLQAHVVGVGVLNSEHGTHYPGHSHFEHCLPLAVVVGPGMLV